jgi:glycosyltransferase involved in cell wall biosynthesis
LRQSFTDFEVLVVGDGCTDESEEVVTAIADPRVRWINLAVNNGHQSAPNNEGLRQSRGSIVAYLGHDDLWLPHHLEMMVAAIDSGTDVANGIVHMIGAEGNILPPAGGLQQYRAGHWLPPTGVAHRRTAAETVGGWQDYRNLSIDPETDLWLRMSQAGLKFHTAHRLTAVKFSASRRKDCYKTRSSDEQRQWTDRILNEKDLEAVELGKIAVELGKIAEELKDRLPEGRPESTGMEPGAMVRQRRWFKGL